MVSEEDKMSPRAFLKRERDVIEEMRDALREPSECCKQWVNDDERERGVESKDKRRRSGKGCIATFAIVSLGLAVHMIKPKKRQKSDLSQDEEEPHFSSPSCEEENATSRPSTCGSIIGERSSV